MKLRARNPKVIPRRLILNEAEEICTGRDSFAELQEDGEVMSPDLTGIEIDQNTNITQARKTKECLCVNFFAAGWKCLLILIYNLFTTMIIVRPKMMM